MATLRALPSTGRISRRPSHTFQVRHKPWTIQPFMIAPVLPGETMKNLLLQARIVTDPIKNPLIGWWIEYYFFYVKHRDLAFRDEYEQMVLDPSWTIDDVDTAAANVKHYYYGDTIDWVGQCLDRVVEEYFRDEGEAVTVVTIDGMPVASITGNSWMDSVTDATLVANTDVDDTDIGATDLDAAMRQWEFMRLNKLTNMSYEDFLGTYGVRPNKEEAHKPELVRFIREWSYPSNTVDPSTGTPSSAVSWSVAERADKDRFFREPGFLFGVTVARPKVYFSKQVGAAVGMLNNAFSWLPAVMNDDPYTSLRTFASAADATGGPLQANPTNGYIVDVRDLFLYGDQFLNFALTETNAGLVALPTAALQKRYAAETDADALFSADTAEYVRQDGIVSLNVLGRQVDQT